LWLADSPGHPGETVARTGGGGVSRLLRPAWPTVNLGLEGPRAGASAGSGAANLHRQPARRVALPQTGQPAVAAARTTTIGGRTGQGPPHGAGEGAGELFSAEQRVLRAFSAQGRSAGRSSQANSSTRSFARSKTRGVCVGSPSACWIFRVR